MYRAFFSFFRALGCDFYIRTLLYFGIYLGVVMFFFRKIFLVRILYCIGRTQCSPTTRRWGTPACNSPIYNLESGRSKLRTRVVFIDSLSLLQDHKTQDANVCYHYNTMFETTSAALLFPYYWILRLAFFRITR